MKLAVAVVVLATRIGFAQPDDEGTEQAVRARDADRAGRDHYAAHDYGAAVEDYRRAHDALPDPLFLFDMAQSYRKLDDCPHAAEMYRAYLKDLPNADNRRRVEQFIVDMDACSPAAPVTTPVVHVTDSRALQFTGIGTAALGLVLVGVGVYFSVAASDDASMIESMCAHGCRGTDVANLNQAGHESNRDAAITYTLGGVALAAGVGILLWETLGSTGAPVIEPVTGGATVSGRFRF